MSLLKRLVAWIRTLFANRELAKAINAGVPGEIEPVRIRETATTQDVLPPPVVKPEPKPVPAPEPLKPIAAFLGGWWHRALMRPAHPGRVGPAIKPWSIVVHTTDTLPGTFAGIIRRVTTERGEGNGAHFWIDRDGIVYQTVSIYRNGAHAGGAKGHGWYVVGGKYSHPNSVAIGIEVHAAGGVKRKDGAWWYESSGGKLTRVPDADVTPDPGHKDRGWHGPTAAQFASLRDLVADLDAVLPKPPVPCEISPNGEVPAWGRSPSVRVVGHVTLDPARKSDPGVPGMDWVRAFLASKT